MKIKEEYWNIGTLEYWALEKHHAITPSFHYSSLRYLTQCSTLRSTDQCGSLGGDHPENF